MDGVPAVAGNGPWRPSLPGHGPRYLPYWAGFVLFNYRSLGGTLLHRPGRELSLGGNAVWLAAARIAPMAAGLLFWALAALAIPADRLGLASAVVSATMLTVQLGMLGVGPRP